MLKGFFNLPEEPVPLLRVRLADDKTYEVRHGTVMVSDGSTKQGHDDGGFIAVKVSEGSGVILKTRAASEEHSLIAGSSNPRHSHNSFRNEDYNYSSQANWLQEPRYFTIF